MTANTNWIGLLIAVAAAIVSNAGVNMQKRSHNRSQDKDDDRPYYVHKRWMCGMLCVVLGALMDFGAFAFASQTLVTAVGGGSTVVANVFFASFWLGEALSPKDAAGTALLIGGVVLAVLASDESQDYTLEQLEHQFVSVTFLVYMAALAGTVAALMGYARALQAYDGRTICGVRFSQAKAPYFYATVSGMLGSVSVLLGKCAAEMVKQTVLGNNQFTYFTTYTFFAGMIVTVVAQTHYLNVAISGGDVLSVFPVFQVNWIGFSVLGGIVFYKQYKHFTSSQWIMFPAAMVLVDVGIYLLSQHKSEGYESLPTERAKSGDSAEPAFFSPTLQPMAMTESPLPQRHPLQTSINMPTEHDDPALLFSPTLNRHASFGAE